MSDDRDIRAVTSWEQRDEDYDGGGGHAIPYTCVDCEFTGGTLSAVEHHRETGHAVRGVHWPTRMGNAQFNDAGPDGRRKT